MSGANLYEAHRNWASRPDDERFTSLVSLRDFMLSRRQRAIQTSIPTSQLRVTAKGDDIVLVGRTGTEASFTNWAFTQLCSRVKAPASYVSGLPSTIATDCLNHGLSSTEDNESKILFDQNGHLTIRAFTGDGYSRIWDAQVVERLMVLEAQGWKTTPCKYSDEHSIYAGDRDMFVFMVEDKYPIQSSLGRYLNRGFFVWNSEVGAKTVGIKRFLYDRVCGNHIVWDVEDVRTYKRRHVGDADIDWWEKFHKQAALQLQSSPKQIEAEIQRLRTTELPERGDELAQVVYTKLGKKLPYTVIEAGLEAVEQHPEDGSPVSLWGIMSGITRVTQEFKHADKRSEMDSVAGTIPYVKW